MQNPTFLLFQRSKLTYYKAMRKFGYFALICAIMVTLVAFAATAAYAQTKQIKVANAKSSDAASFNGEDLYRQFCAVCHGADGKGTGPAAAALKAKATDLTQMSRQNSGKFPALHVKNILTGADNVASHGSAEMPTWGDTFKSISSNATFGQMRIDALVDYLQKVQR
jgi:mono/diheme cytochrome c family protein